MAGTAGCSRLEGVAAERRERRTKRVRNSRLQAETSVCVTMAGMAKAPRSRHVTAGCRQRPAQAQEKAGMAEIPRTRHVTVDQRYDQRMKKA